MGKVQGNKKQMNYYHWEIRFSQWKPTNRNQMTL